MTRVKTMLPFLPMCIVAFYVLPLIDSDAGYLLFALLVFMPLVCFLSALFFGLRNGLSFWYPALIALLFVPSMFLFYSFATWFYCLAYYVIGLLGCLIGARTYNRQNK